MKRRGWIGSTLLLVTLLLVGGSLAAWKRAADQDAEAAAAAAPEPSEAITAATATPRQHRQTTTSIGTVLAMRSISLRNELPGTVERVMLNPGQIVEPGTLLVALDVSVEEAELKTRQAEAALAETLLERVKHMSQSQAASETEVDRAKAERDIALSQVERAKAVIARKTIHAPFRARVGLADTHPGQYLEAGTLLTTLQGVDEAAHVDFTVAQRVAAALKVGETVEVFAAGVDETPAIPAEIVAIDARVDPSTRNASVRARIANSAHAPAPGASVRVRVPVGPQATAVAVPVSAVRKGPGGDHIFALVADGEGKTRVQLRLVKSGAVIGDEILILDGLAVGDQVAAAGSFKLRDGALVAVAAAKQPATAPTTEQQD